MLYKIYIHINLYKSVLYYRICTWMMIITKKDVHQHQLYCITLWATWLLILSAMSIAVVYFHLNTNGRGLHARDYTQRRFTERSYTRIISRNGLDTMIKKNRDKCVTIFGESAIYFQNFFKTYNSFYFPKYWWAAWVERTMIIYYSSAQYIKLV